jgi:carboxyl-terminal processing protease
VDTGIGYIRISDFTTNTSKEVKQAMESLKGQGADGLVIDLRGNPGGLLSEAINVSNLFIEKGREVVSTKGRSQEWNKTYRALNKPVDLEIPLVVLVGKNSASASEIVAGVMQDYDRGILVGRQTFGKGLVQGTRPLSYDAQLKITTAKYYIPSGRCIQAIDYGDKGAEAIPDSLKVAFRTENGREVFDGAGVSPDVVVESEQLAPITTALLTSALIFDYVTEYRLKNEAISDPQNFSLSDQEYNDFKKWIGEKKVSYQSESEKYLQQLAKSSKTEELYAILKADIEKLRARVEKEKEDDLDEYKPQIKKVLEEQIASYYYSEKGAIISALREDADLTTAIKVLKDQDRYRKILAGK